jgi:hypothetical protein
MNDIQSRYNKLTSLATSCRIFIPPWTTVHKTSTLGTEWDTVVSAAYKAKFHEMSTAIHHLLSHKDIFAGECAHFSKLTTTTNDGYGALYNILRHKHPALGSAPKQAKQPVHKKYQEFLPYTSEYIDYFQLEQCEGRQYDDSTKALIVIDNLHSIWRNTFRR